MVHVKKEGIILEKTHLGFENEGVLNPAVIADGPDVHIFYRAVRKGNFSTLGYCRLRGPLTLVERFDKPVIFPQMDYESQGVEDPRIVFMEGKYYLSYTAYDGINALGALAISTDLVHFEKLGIITPCIRLEEYKHLAECQSKLSPKYLRHYEYHKMRGELEHFRNVWDKNLVFFPRRINGKIAFLHRIWPGIQLTMVNSLDELDKTFWEHYVMSLSNYIVMDPYYPHESSHIGAGCPPLETPHGWILIYHGVYDSPEGYVYSACAALLDLENPYHEIARLPYTLFKPEHEWEVHGEVNNVCFPTGMVVHNDTIYIYYGAADEKIGCASLSLQELTSELLANKIDHGKRHVYQA